MPINRNHWRNEGLKAGLADEHETLLESADPSVWGMSEADTAELRSALEAFTEGREEARQTLERRAARDRKPTAR